MTFSPGAAPGLEVLSVSCSELPGCVLTQPHLGGRCKQGEEEGKGEGVREDAWAGAATTAAGQSGVHGRGRLGCNPAPVMPAGEMRPGGGYAPPGTFPADGVNRNTAR